MTLGEDDGIREQARIPCAHSGCDETRPDHQWGTRGKYTGWFAQRDGTNWCPKHVPEWVDGWRAQRSGSVPSTPSTAPVGYFESKPD